MCKWSPAASRKERLVQEKGQHFLKQLAFICLSRITIFLKLQSKIQQILGGLTFNEYLILRIFLSDHTYKQLVSHIFIIPLIVMHLFFYYLLDQLSSVINNPKFVPKPNV